MRYGSKLAAIVELLRAVKGRGEKAIMFVQWTDLMRALRASLSRVGVKAVAIIGNTNSRNAAINRMKNGDADVLLLSMDISTTGLNLTEANHVIFAHALVGGSPTTQQLVVSQAVARVHRTGQQKQVYVHWFITRDTDEQRVFVSTLPPTARV
jgi:SNF2 family DNA or RNA helicase